MIAKATLRFLPLRPPPPSVPSPPSSSSLPDSAAAAPAPSACCCCLPFCGLLSVLQSFFQCFCFWRLPPPPPPPPPSCCCCGCRPLPSALRGPTDTEEAAAGAAAAAEGAAAEVVVAAAGVAAPAAAGAAATGAVVEAAVAATASLIGTSTGCETAAAAGEGAAASVAGESASAGAKTGTESLITMVCDRQSRKQHTQGKRRHRVSGCAVFQELRQQAQRRVPPARHACWFHSAPPAPLLRSGLHRIALPGGCVRRARSRLSRRCGSSAQRTVRGCRASRRRVAPAIRRDSKACPQQQAVSSSPPPASALPCVALLCLAVRRPSRGC